MDLVGRVAAVPVSACVALHGLRDDGELAAGQKALIVGASGGVGTLAVQIAKVLGTVGQDQASLRLQRRLPLRPARRFAR